MKILVMTPWYPSTKNQGSGIFVKELNEALEMDGFEILVIHFTARKGKEGIEIEKETKAQNLRTIHLNLRSKFWRYYWHFPSLYFNKTKKYLTKIIDDFNPEIIHNHVVFPSAILSNKIAKQYNIPFITTEHWSGTSRYFKKHPSRFHGKKALKKTSGIYPVSHFLKSQIEKYIKHDTIEPIGNIVDESAWSFEGKNLNSNVICFTAIANWKTQKNITKRPELIIKALSKIQAPLNKKIHLELIGSGDKLESLKELANNLNLSLTCHGHLDKIQIKDCLSKTNYFVHASEIETFGIVVLEALLTGTPVICSNVGALTNWISDENGILVENNLSAWINGIEKALSKSYDYLRISKEFKNTFSKDTIVKKYLEAYNSAILEH